ncbi:MAG TPA: DNA adenine methylase [Chloroflexota bacterium]|nr:DNA adenine methylase [Chloroflexota bacterium]
MRPTFRSGSHLKLPMTAVPPPTTAPKPFLKWAGGKTQLLSQIAPHFPTEFNHYCEPFTGSAAVYWHLYSLREQGVVHFSDVHLADSNAELVNCYQVVRDEVDALIEQLTQHRQQHQQTYYYQIRAQNTAELSPVARAARLIYLNKTCYNGLYRVNRAGQFNVPMGRYKNPAIFDTTALQSASRALQGVEVVQADFRELLHWAQAGDFIYFDPPYAPLSKTSSFTSYTADAFGEQEQVELAAVLHELDQRGCKVMLSNSWTPAILALYQDFHCLELKASRAINSKASKRGPVSELLALNYP